MHRILMAAILMTELAGPLTSPAAAQHVAPAIEAWARKIERGCAAAFPGEPDKLAPQRNADWLTTASEDASGKIMIAQGDKTRCAPQSQLICGTGGCVFAAFRVGKAGVRKLYDDQAHSWRLDASANPPVLRFHVHGSRCGGFGPDPCETVVDLRTGAKRTGKPKD